MADIPKGATLIDNPVSAAPGFNIQRLLWQSHKNHAGNARRYFKISNLAKTFISIACEIGEGNLKGYW